MPLEALANGHFAMKGSITFDNAVTVVTEGKKQLMASASSQGVTHWCIDLAFTEQADSSALSVLLSWMRLAQKEGTTLSFQNMPAQLEALVQVADLEELLQKPF
ncbi:STAS domain-containing protein [Candidatus Sororendozoicomonas aggregata]|uniref:STAS domain-containing protein n=1 Tax=Candidatus Sororendozoicomonas aggregata TaxID=3073239 RepID=UPI002ED3B279